MQNLTHNMRKKYQTSSNNSSRSLGDHVANLVDDLIISRTVARSVKFIAYSSTNFKTSFLISENPFTQSITISLNYNMNPLTDDLFRCYHLAVFIAAGRNFFKILHLLLRSFSDANSIFRR